MKKFNSKVNEILNENIFGAVGNVIGGAVNVARTVLQNVVDAAANIMVVGKDPAKLDAILKNINSRPEVQKASTFNANYKPNTGTTVACIQSFAGKEPIIGKVTSSPNSVGQFKVKLVNVDGSPSRFAFVKTVNKPEWRLDYVSSINSALSKDPILVDPKTKAQQISPSKAMPDFTVGKGTKFPDWVDYKEYMKASK